MSTVTTVIATVIAMFLLSWQLALFALVPAAALRADDAQGRQAAPRDRHRAAGVDGRHLVARAGVAVGLGDPARQDDGPLDRARRALRLRVAAPRRARDQEPHGGPLDDGVDPDDVRDHARGGLLGRRLHRRRLDRHARRLHDAADAALRADRQPALDLGRRAELARAVRPRSSSTSTCPSTSSRARATLEHVRGDVRLEDVWFRYGERRVGAARASTSRSRPARRRRSSARPARARRRSATSSRGSTT